jgi:hypothetical protein
MPKAPKISKETLALVNKVREVNNTLMDGGISCLRFSEVEEMMDALTDVVKFFDLKHKGGISDWGENEGKYVEHYYSDYVAPTDPEAYDPKKNKENDDE